MLGASRIVCIVSLVCLLPDRYLIKKERKKERKTCLLASLPCRQQSFRSQDGEERPGQGVEEGTLQSGKSFLLKTGIPPSPPCHPPSFPPPPPSPSPGGGRERQPGCPTRTGAQHDRPARGLSQVDIQPDQGSLPKNAFLLDPPLYFKPFGILVSEQFLFWLYLQN